MENKIKINKCIRCGNTACNTYHHIDCYTTKYGVKCMAHPNDCTNSIRGYETQEDAIKEWNRKNSYL